MPKSKRGGARKGSGRPRILTDIQRLQVGGAIQHLLVCKVSDLHRAKVDARLAEIIERCLAPNPENRFANVQEVLDALANRERARVRR